MKFLIGLVLLTSTTFPTTSRVGGRCISTAIEVDPITVASGSEVQAIAHFTNCGGNNLSNVGVQVYAYREPTGDCYTTIIPYTLISNIPAGQTITMSGSFMPVCAGDWEAYSSMHPSSLWAYGEAGFIVTP